jgi:hypothetical protein
MYHCESWHHSSQCFLLTTLDLKPTAAAEGTFVGISGRLSRSEYLPTRIIFVSSGRVRVIVGNCSEGLPARGSWCGIKRIDGRCLLPFSPSAWVVSAASMLEVADVGCCAAGIGPDWDRTVGCTVVVSARVRVIVGEGKGLGGSLGCDIVATSGEVRVRDRRLELVVAALWVEKEGDMGGGVVLLERARARA